MSESLRWLSLLEKSLNRDLSVQHHHLMVFLVLLTINKKIAVKYIPLHASHTQAKFAVRNNWNWKNATGAGVRTRMNESSTYHKKRVKVESKKLYLIDHKGLRDFLKSHLKFHLNSKPFRGFQELRPHFIGFMEATRHIDPCKVYSLWPMGSYAPVFRKVYVLRFSSTNFLVKPCWGVLSK